jgi:hypothetical protein
MNRGGGLLKADGRVVAKWGRHPVLKVIPQENLLFLGGGGGAPGSRRRTASRLLNHNP